MVVAVVIIILMILLFIYVVWKVSSRKRRKNANVHTHKNIDNGEYKQITWKGNYKPTTWKDSYREDLNDGRWKEKREKILKRDGYRCRWCGCVDGLQVHHKYYNKYPDGGRVKAWDYPDDALMVLCGDCHKEYHSKHKVKSYYRKNGVHYENV